MFFVSGLYILYMTGALNSLIELFKVPTLFHAKKLDNIKPLFVLFCYVITIYILLKNLQ